MRAETEPLTCDGDCITVALLLQIIAAKTKRLARRHVSCRNVLKGAKMAKSASKPAAKKEPKNKLLEQMRANPKGDWKLSDIETVSKRNGLQCVAHKRGSHHSVWSPLLEGQLTIPARRPIKAVYIKNFIAMCDAHMKAPGAKDG